MNMKRGIIKMTNDSNERKIEWLRSLKEEYERKKEETRKELDSMEYLNDADLDVSDYRFKDGYWTALDDMIQDLEELLK